MMKLSYLLSLISSIAIVLLAGWYVIFVQQDSPPPTRTPRQGQTVLTPTPNVTLEPSLTGTPLPGNLDQVIIVDDGQEHIVRRLIPQDWIMPIYNPRFTDNPDAYDDEELVMGVEINGDARAYSVGFLTRREMVNDEVGGTPILVTW